MESMELPDPTMRPASTIVFPSLAMCHDGTSSNLRRDPDNGLRARQEDATEA